MGFLLGIAAVFGIALAAGAQRGPVGGPAEAHDSGHAGAHSTEGSPEVPGGLMVSSGGYTFAQQNFVARAGRHQRIAFVIEAQDGPVTAYDVEQGKLLHLIAVRRDFTGFQHVHPELAPDGTWTPPLDLPVGQWRLFADFKPTGADPITLGVDLSIAGRVGAAPVPQTTRVARDGRPVTDLQPYLGAYGHLVALRGGDLACLHVHPDGEPADGATRPGPDVEFGAEVPSAGRYHLYLDFKHGGVVRTAQFALDAGSDR